MLYFHVKYFFRILWWQEVKEQKNFFIRDSLLFWIFFYLQGCYKVVKDRLISHLHIVIGTACGVLALQILGIIFAFCLCKAIGNDRDYHYKYWPRSTKDDLQAQQGAAAEPQPQTKKNAAPAPPSRPPSHLRKKWKNNFPCVFFEWRKNSIVVFFDEEKRSARIFLKHLFLAKILWLSTRKQKITNKKPREFMILFLVATLIVCCLGFLNSLAHDEWCWRKNDSPLSQRCMMC